MNTTVNKPNSDERYSTFLRSFAEFLDFYDAYPTPTISPIDSEHGLDLTNAPFNFELERYLNSMHEGLAGTQDSLSNESERISETIDLVSDDDDTDCLIIDVECAESGEPVELEPTERQKKKPAKRLGTRRKAPCVYRKRSNRFIFSKDFIDQISVATCAHSESKEILPKFPRRGEKNIPSYAPHASTPLSEEEIADLVPNMEKYAAGFHHFTRFFGNTSKNIASAAAR